MSPIRVLLITRNLPPLIGGMERLNLELIRALAAEFSVAVCGPRGAAEHLPDCRVEEVPLRPLRQFLLQSAHRARLLAREWQPQVVVAGSGLTAPAAWLAARVCAARTLAYVHGLDLIVRHPVYQALWLPAIRRMDAVIANSNATRETAVRRGIERARTDIIYCGAPPPLVAGTAMSEAEVHARLPSGRFIVSVGRILRRKGLPEFVEQAFPRLRQRLPDLQLVVIGGEAEQALRGGGGEMQRLREAASRQGLQDAIHVLGVVPTEVLVAALQRAQAFVFPVLDIPGDVEGFGAVALEAAASGCPTVAFAVGGVPDAVRDGVSGRLIEAGDYRGMVDAIEALIELPAEERSRWAARAKGFAAGFSWTRFGEQIRAQVRRLASGAG